MRDGNFTAFLCASRAPAGAIRHVLRVKTLSLVNSQDDAQRSVPEADPAVVEATRRSSPSYKQMPRTPSRR